MSTIENKRLGAIDSLPPLQFYPFTDYEQSLLTHPGETALPHEVRRHVVAKAIIEGWAGNLDILDELIHPDFVNLTTMYENEPRGPAGIKRLIGRFRRAFPDLTVRVEEMLSDPASDAVATRVRMRGTHTGGVFLMGTLPIPPSGRSLDVMNVHFDRVGSDGRISEHYGFPQKLEAMQQLGVFPPTATTLRVVGQLLKNRLQR